MTGDIVASRSLYWDNLYKHYHFAYGRIPNLFLRQQAHRLRKGMQALVVGDGEGRNSVWLAQKGLSVISVDFSLIALQRAKQWARLNRVSVDFQFCDLVEWKWKSNEFDLIVSIFLHLAEWERRSIHKKMIASLKPEGCLLLEAFHQRSAHSSEACSLYTPSILKQDFGPLAIEELLEGTITLNEGYLHQGPADVVRLVARRPATRKRKVWKGVIP